MKSHGKISVTDTVEAYNTVTNTCAIVHGVRSSVNCVPFRSSLYKLTFGRKDKDDNCVSHVQMYDTKPNTSTILSTQMPRHQRLMLAALCDTSVILLGSDTCLIFNFETETWQERKKFKADATQFALVRDNERVFIAGGLMKETEKYGNVVRKCRHDVRFVPIRNILEDKPIE